MTALPDHVVALIEEKQRLDLRKREVDEELTAWFAEASATLAGAGVVLPKRKRNGRDTDYRAVVEFVQVHATGVTAGVVAVALGLTINSVRAHLSAAATSGDLRRLERGIYAGTKEAQS